ncbi:hypothetical protein BDK51DRAFT_38246 [Blyttiomyces helicus]|uniref:Periplasmic binding protein domain-containing protein n=1 Tax=Blyttiomyces helicus TaxID=388810 RepID=A0A4P9W789_9FUNG|nr:hypothetical protein BDK51DRAFT_38246 [Blyttiomyces helicus]|eukprot:RKO86878.1 hypothetical protein BDK51DRAFT_38246 [Blyttiomyces helicus]
MKGKVFLRAFSQMRLTVVVRKHALPPNRTRRLGLECIPGSSRIKGKNDGCWRGVGAWDLHGSNRERHEHDLRVRKCWSYPHINGIFAVQWDVVPVIHSAIALVQPPRDIFVAVDDFNTADVLGWLLNGTVGVGSHQQPFLQGFLPTAYMYTLLTVNETIYGSGDTAPAVATGPLLMDNSTLPLAYTISQTESVSAFNLSTPRRIIAMFHQSDLYDEQNATITGIADAAAAFRYSLNTLPLQNEYNETAQIAALAAAFAGCAGGVAACPEALITSNPTATFVAAAADLAARATIPYVVVGQDRFNASLGVHLWIGMDNYRAGFDAGEALVAAGARRPLCACPSSDEMYALRCEGMSAAYAVAGVGSVLAPVVLDPFIAQNAQAQFLAYLQVGKMDSVLCTFAPLCDALYVAIQLQKSNPVIPIAVSIGVDPSTVGLLIDGIVQLAIETAPYTQGFLAMIHTGLVLEASSDTIARQLSIGGSPRTWGCPAGYYYSGTTEVPGTMYARLPSGAMGLGTVCAPCGVDSFAGADNARACSACPFGTYVNATAAVTCQSCLDGIGIGASGCAAFFSEQEVPPTSRASVKGFAYAGIGGFREGGIGKTFLPHTASCIPAITVILSALLVTFRREPIIRAASPGLAAGVPAGSLMVIVSQLILQGTLDKATCTTSIWLLTTGFGIVMGTSQFDFANGAREILVILLGEWVRPWDEDGPFPDI